MHRILPQLCSYILYAPETPAAQTVEEFLLRASSESAQLGLELYWLLMAQARAAIMVTAPPPAADGEGEGGDGGGDGGGGGGDGSGGGSGALSGVADLEAQMADFAAMVMPKPPPPLKLLLDAEETRQLIAEALLLTADKINAGTPIDANRSIQAAARGHA